MVHAMTSSRPQDVGSDQGVMPERRGLETTLHVARVLAVSDSDLRVAVDEQEMRASRAFGCLVAPAAGDRVLLARAGADAFVLSVLDRLVGDSACLSVPGASALTIAARDITLEADRRLEAGGGEEAVLRGARLSLHGRTLSIVGRTLSLVVDHLRSLANRSEQTADVMAVHAGERTTVVRGADVAQAGTLVQQVDTVSSSSAATAVIVAREDVRVDAKRVTVG